PLALDARLQRVVRTLQRIDADTGALLRPFFERGLHRQLGFASISHYARERLGISGRKARALVAIARKAEHCPSLAAAYGQGALSWLRALTLLGVVEDKTEAAWVKRAQDVTLKRLCDEVEWALATPGGPVAPPPIDAPMPRQIGARSDTAVL